MSGDLISQIDDEAVQGLSLEQAVNKMKGAVNTKAKLKILRKGKDAPLDVTLMREIIRVRTVRFHTEGGGPNGPNASLNAAHFRQLIT